MLLPLAAVLRSSNLAAIIVVFTKSNEICAAPVMVVLTDKIVLESVVVVVCGSCCSGCTALVPFPIGSSTAKMIGTDAGGLD